MLTFNLVVYCLLVVRTINEEYFMIIRGGRQHAEALGLRHNLILKHEIMSDFYVFETSGRNKRATNNIEHLLSMDDRIELFEKQVPHRRVKRGFVNASHRQVDINDAKYDWQWYLKPRPARPDMNVRGAWNMGYTGKNVVVTIIDDGIEKSHPDLIENYDKQASFDVNNNREDPSPRYDHSNTNNHGTRCAGEVAASRNKVCVVGVAFDASIGGIKILDGRINDQVECRSLAYRQDYISIYSSSWGPDDDGRTVDGPKSCVLRTFKKGVEDGRGGKGSIFIWASGNGGDKHDNCNCDGYASSIYTLTISGVDSNGEVPWYSELCAATISTTYSSGKSTGPKIATTDIHKSCTKDHTGSSAAAPIFAAIVALVLQANPLLTWRDIQHLAVISSNHQLLKLGNQRSKVDKVAVNGIGRQFSHSFGFGLIDAAAMVKNALEWNGVPEQTVCTKIVPKLPFIIDPEDPIKNHDFRIQLSQECKIRYNEHAVVTLDINGGPRRSLSIYLTSALKTKSQLLSERKYDSGSNFHDWSFMSVHFWGEDPIGEWVLTIKSTVPRKVTVNSIKLVVYGTIFESNPLNKTYLFKPNHNNRSLSNISVLNRIIAYIVIANIGANFY